MFVCLFVSFIAISDLFGSFGGVIPSKKKLRNLYFTQEWKLEHRNARYIKTFYDNYEESGKELKK